MHPHIFVASFQFVVQIGEENELGDPPKEMGVDEDEEHMVRNTVTVSWFSLMTIYLRAYFAVFYTNSFA